jgi:hypothetical protein
MGIFHCETRHAKTGVEWKLVNFAEATMRKLIFGVALFLVIPALRAQQEQPNDNPPSAVSQEPSQNSNAQNSLPDAIKPGHPLDPADVDVLTGKKDREAEAARRPAVSVMVGGYGYGNYGGSYATYGRDGAILDFPLLPLPRLRNPFFFSLLPPRSFGSRGFRGGR